MNLSVIIPCLNAAGTIAVQLQALADQKWQQPWEVILADNGSTDDTVLIAQSYTKRVPSLNIVDASHRKGVSYAMNLGASFAQGEALAFCDADDEVAPGWVAAIGNALRSHDCVASRFDFERLNSWMERTAQLSHPQTKGLQRLWYPPYLVFAGACGLGVRKTLHQAVGGFDESFFVVSDAEYCVKIQLAGSEMAFCPEALVHIRCRQNATASFRQVYHWGQFNTLLYKRYRANHTQQRSPWKTHVRGWIETLRNVPQLGTAQGRVAWFTRLGWQMGNLTGSIKHRVPPVPSP